MDANTKLQEMEEEIKVLKAEIRNVLLDIREVILDRTNPLDEGPEPQMLRMDLRTTASAMAAEAAAHQARSAVDALETEPEPEATPAAEELGEELPLLLEKAEEPPAPEPEPEAIAEVEEEPPPPKVIRRDPRELKMLAEEREPIAVEIPPAYRADVAPLSGNGSLASWLSDALSVVGPQELNRIIAAHRAWGNLPPNISRALAHVQEMLERTEDADPAWLRVMQQLDTLASL